MNTKLEYSKDRIKKVRETYNVLLEDLGREPLAEEIAAEAGLEDVGEVKEMLDYKIEELDADDFQLRFKLTIKNHELEKLRSAMNLTQEQVALKIGIGIQTYSTIESCRQFPSVDQQNKIAKFFNTHPDKLFPNWLAIFSQKWKDNENKSIIVPISRLRLNDPKVLQVQSGDYDEIVRQADNRIVRTVVEKAMAELTPRESGILNHRFGLDGLPHTLQETAKSFGVTSTRIMQIEAKALDKLRQSANIKSISP